MGRFIRYFGPWLEFDAYNSWGDGAAAPSEHDLTILEHNLLELMDEIILHQTAEKPDGTGRYYKKKHVYTNDFRIFKDTKLFVEKQQKYPVGELVERTKEYLNLLRQVRAELSPGETPSRWYKCLNESLPNDQLRILVVDDESSWVNELKQTIREFPELEILAIAQTTEQAIHCIEQEQPQGIIMSGISNCELGTGITDYVAALPLLEQPEIKVAFHCGGQVMDDIFNQLPLSGRRVRTFNLMDNVFENHYSYVLADFYEITDHMVLLPNMGRGRTLRFLEYRDGSPIEVPFFQFWRKYTGYRARRYRIEAAKETITEVCKRRREIGDAVEDDLLSLEEGRLEDNYISCELITGAYDMDGFRYIYQAESERLSEAIMKINPHRYIEEYMEYAPLYFDGVPLFRVETYYVRTLFHDGMRLEGGRK